MSLLRPLSVLLIPLLGGCSAFDSDPGPVEYSPGFFATFAQMMDVTMASGTAETQSTTLTNEFNRHVNEGPRMDELYAVAGTWDKVRAFLDIGVVSAEIMESVDDSAQHRVDMYADAADWVLRSDFVAITAWNQEVDASRQIRPTAEIVWESLHLVITESGHAERKIPVTKGEKLDGYWTRTATQARDLWVNGHYEPVWHAGRCYDNYVGTSCSSFWVSESCTDVWIDDGYWESTCSAYDDDGNCVEWTDEWISTGYYETQCVEGHYEEQCTDVYETVCESGKWVDVWIEPHAVKGASIPGELAWVEPHEAKADGERVEVLLEQEAAILALGIEYVASYGPDFVDANCATELQKARNAFDTETAAQSIRTSRQSILYCLSKH